MNPSLRDLGKVGNEHGDVSFFTADDSLCRMCQFPSGEVIESLEAAFDLFSHHFSFFHRRVLKTHVIIQGAFRALEIERSRARECSCERNVEAQARVAASGKVTRENGYSDVLLEFVRRAS